ncbi:uncharacterized protein LOC128267525 [Anopheles cruzii]|uniref:uncharacterized protein LOC128267525 n=1 Tax=Anopheles cruzii TaxID=68878 RepID=UPI0022EC512E|nr:uncharacterized protein LOC128267525 [Anopheles cruzii]XP_052860336.1 uncharacterized protein LOC128267525 [Anopheles cruzii]
MADSEPPPPCNIDILRPDRTHISAWRDKAEFRAVYDRVFATPTDDIAAKEEAIRWMNVWKIRQNKETPVCVRCTLAVLEAQVFDRRQAGESNTAEIKSIYAGAFTRFINCVTEGRQTHARMKRKPSTIAQHVRSIGIEPYLVELRHLCAHSSVSIAIDVFRRSAEYCMNWLKVSYWERELATMEPVTYATFRRPVLGPKHTELCRVLRAYDAATAALVRKVSVVQKARPHLSDDEFRALQAYETEYGTSKLGLIVDKLVDHLEGQSFLRQHSVTVWAVCEALLSECPYLLKDPLKKGPQQERMAKVHGPLFRALAAIGCLQEFFERLVAICEDAEADDQRRLAAQYWALKLVIGFQLLKEFKKHCKSLPADRLVLFAEFYSGKRKRLAFQVAEEWYGRRALKEGTPNHSLILGVTADCPWHLRLDRAYLVQRLQVINDYTKPIVAPLSSLVEPALRPRQLQGIERLTKILTMARATKAPRWDGTTSKVYTMEDVYKATGKRPPAASGDTRWGPWRATDDSIEWKYIPLGMSPSEL